MGLKYIPLPCNLKNIEIENSISRLENSLLKSIHFSHQISEHTNNVPKKLMVKSLWQPAIDSHSKRNLSRILYKFKNKILKHFIYKHTKKSLNNIFTKSLTDIRKRNDIKVLQSDKNLGLLVLNTTDYHKMIKKQLTNNVYNNLSSIYTIDEFERSTKITIQYDLNKILPILKKHEIKYLQQDLNNFKVFAFFHGIPKLHKGKVFPNFPLRPIVAGRPNQIQARLSCILSERLLPKLKEFDTVLHNSITLKNDLEGFHIDNSIFISIDFESLYTSIPLRDLYKSISEFTKWETSFRDECILLLKVIFENNYFVYGNEIFLQNDGIAMGTNVAPIIASIYLAIKFDSITKSLPRISKFSRYIDDCFFIFNGNIQQFLDFEFPILQSGTSIGLTYEYGESINFLDLTIFKTSENRIAFKVFQKILNKYQYLPLISFHPPATIRGFIIGELIRYKRICSFNYDFYYITQLFYNRLLNRGFNTYYLTRIFGPFIGDYNGFPIIKNNTKTTHITFYPNQDKTFRVFIRYTPQNVYFINFFKKELFKLSTQVSKLFLAHCEIQTVFTSNPNVINLTVRSALSSGQIKLIQHHETCN